MANLIISSVCNQDCPYCFTTDHRRAQPRAPRFLPIAALDSRLRFLRRSGVEHVRLVGGEPTLHPQFIQITQRAMGAGLKLSIFSNGLMPENALDYVASLSEDGCSVLVNVNDPRYQGDDTHARRLATIRRLGPRATLGFNIYRADADLTFLLDVVQDTGCEPRIRLGLALPTLSGRNEHLLPSQYVAVGRKVVQFAALAGRRSTSVSFDCGFVRCMFSDEGLATLESYGADVGWRCNPILDVGIDGQVMHCFPLAAMGALPLTENVDARDLRDVFMERTKAYRRAGIFPECSQCAFKLSGECPGGCLAVTMRRFRHTPFALALPIGQASP